MTDEFCQQMQTRDKIGIPAPSMIVQPIGTIDPMKAYNNVEVRKGLHINLYIRHSINLLRLKTARSPIEHKCYWYSRRLSTTKLR